MGLVICLLVIIPWTVLRWQKGPDAKTPDFSIRVIMPNGQVETMLLETYLTAVVAAEMPAEFAPEALKAQAVAARTYAAKRINKSSTEDIGYDVDTTTQTQSWLSPAEMRTKWGGWLNYWRYKKLIEQAVAGTSGQVLVANGDYIDALYHASSGRKPTEKAEDVWGVARSYLRNEDAQEDQSLRIVRTVTFSLQELAAMLNLNPARKTFTAADIQLISRTQAGRVKELRLLGVTYHMTRLRTLLGLASADLEWTVKPDQVTFVTYGSGHAVGMSQYGANDMAKKGRKYRDILAYYYPGTSLLTLTHK